MTTLSRRRFLGATGRLGAAALIAPALPGLLEATPLGGAAGIQLYAVKDSLAADPAATLRRVREIGFREVETAGFAGLSARDFRRLLDAQGLTAPSAHLDFSVPETAFEQAHDLGAQYAASGSLRGLVARELSGGMTLDEAHRTAALANRLGEQARRAGLRYVYHNHHIEFADQGGSIAYDVLLAGTDPALVQFEIDCGWMVLGGRNPIDYIARYPGRFPMIHVKDFLAAPLRAGNAAAFATYAYPGAELGHGMIDYRPIFAAAEKAGLRHYFVEQEGPFTRMSQIEAARQAYAYVAKIR
ncbi:MAG TPA: sugar phosphate isomerase/epimerase [Steroidobacteraceae bacterium]|nr:sugar phosphate isomerase/epimerase [Steroidobacteraceae bacterium]